MYEKYFFHHFTLFFPIKKWNHLSVSETNLGPCQKFEKTNLTLKARC